MRTVTQFTPTNVHHRRPTGMVLKFKARMAQITRSQVRVRNPIPVTCRDPPPNRMRIATFKCLPWTPPRNLPCRLARTLTVFQISRRLTTHQSIGSSKSHQIIPVPYESQFMSLHKKMMLAPQRHSNRKIYCKFQI